MPAHLATVVCRWPQPPCGIDDGQRTGLGRKVVHPMADAIHSIAGRLGASGHHPMSVWGDALERKAETDNAGHYGGGIAVRRGAHSIPHNLDLIQD